MSEHHEHVDPLGAYLKVFGALMILLLITVGAYFLKFDEWWGPKWGFLNTMIALIIATIKTSLVMLVFMHLRHSTKLTWVIASCGFIWLCIMITFTFADYLSRASVPEADPMIQQQMNQMASATTAVPTTQTAPGF
jgi:cytochrome c oxidase subunit 4